MSLADFTIQFIASLSDELMVLIVLFVIFSWWRLLIEKMSGNI